MDPVQQELFRELARRLALGHSPEQVAREMDTPQSFVEQLLVRDDFLDYFAQNNPKAYSTWKTARDEEEASQVVKHLARGNAIRNFKALQKLVDEEGALKAPERARVLETLLKMSGTIQEEAAVEVVKISSTHLAALTGAAAEVD